MSISPARQDMRSKGIMSISLALEPTQPLPVKNTFISFEVLPPSPLEISRMSTCPPSFAPRRSTFDGDDFSTDVASEDELSLPETETVTKREGTKEWMNVSLASPWTLALEGPIPSLRDSVVMLPLLPCEETYIQMINRQTSKDAPWDIVERQHDAAHTTNSEGHLLHCCDTTEPRCDNGATHVCWADLSEFELSPQHGAVEIANQHFKSEARDQCVQQTHAPAKRSKVTGELLATPGMELPQPLAMPGQPWTLIWVSEQAYKIVGAPQKTRLEALGCNVKSYKSSQNAIRAFDKKRRLERTLVLVCGSHGLSLLIYLHARPELNNLRVVLERPSDSPPLSMNIPYTIVETFDAAVVALQESAASSDFL